MTRKEASRYHVLEMAQHRAEMVETLAEGVDLDQFGYHKATGSELRDYARIYGETPEAWARHQGRSLREVFLEQRGRGATCPWSARQIECALLKRMGFGKVPDLETEAS